MGDAATQAAQNAASLVTQTGGTRPMAQQAAQDAAQMAAAGVNPAQAAILATTGVWAIWGRDGALNPVAGPKRKQWPVKLLPAVAVTDSSGNAILTWTPQEEFTPFRLVFPQGQPSMATGTAAMNQLQAGDRLMQAQRGRTPLAVLAETTDMGRIDFPTVKLGETLTCQITGATATTEIVGVLLGYAKGKPRKLPQGAELLYERIEPFDVTLVQPSSTALITLLPQRNIVMRRLALDHTVANFGNLYVTSINVQDDPQFVQQSEFPAALFSELAQDDWMDFDMCQLGGSVTIGLRNSNTSQTVVAQGMALADLVRLQGDAR